MRLAVARFTNKLGMKHLTNRILMNKFGSVIGKVSQNGLQAFSQEIDKNTKIITVLDKDLFVYSKLNVKRKKNKIVKSTCTFYNQLGQMLRKKEMIVNAKIICHKIFDIQTGDYAQWNYHRATGAIYIGNTGTTGLINNIINIAKTQFKSTQFIQ